MLVYGILSALVAVAGVVGSFYWRSRQTDAGQRTANNGPNLPRDSEDDPDEAIRLAYLEQACTFAPENEDQAAVAIRMSADGSAAVREKACFVLGSLSLISGYDSPEARDALAARLDDDHTMTRALAIEGLAGRGDIRAIVPLAQELQLFAEVSEAYEAFSDDISKRQLTDEEQQIQLLNSGAARSLPAVARSRRQLAGSQLHRFARAARRALL